jgi:hypothetical protein
MIGSNDMEPWKFESVPPYRNLACDDAKKTTTMIHRGDQPGLRRHAPLRLPARGHRHLALPWLDHPWCEALSWALSCISPEMSGPLT